MKRISLTIPEKELNKLDNYVKKFARGSLADNRAATIVDLIRRYIPQTNRISE